MAENDDAFGYDYQTPVVCGGCETPKNVTSFCLNCDADLCDSCKTQLIHRKHTVLPRTHPKIVAARMSMNLPCKQHPGEYYGTYCNTCQKPCCPKCIPKIHDKHEFSDLDIAAKGKREQLSKYTRTLDKEILGNREKQKDTIKKRLTKTKSDAEKHKKTIRQKCQTLRQGIDGMETSLLTQIDKMLKEDTKQLDKQLADIKANEERIRRQLVSCNDVITNASDVHLLMSYHDFPDVTSFDIRNVALPGEVEFIESTKAFPSVEEIIGKLIRKSEDSREGGFDGDVNLKPRVPVYNQKPSDPVYYPKPRALVSKSNLSVVEMARMMKKGSRVKRGRDWDRGNEVMIYFSINSLVDIDSSISALSTNCQHL